MRSIVLIVVALSTLLLGTAAGCSNENLSTVISDAIPENVTSIEASGFYNGSDLKPWELTQAEIDELRIWVDQLSLKHKTYAEGSAPNEVWNGGTAYSFNINNDELSFAWVFIDKAYILYADEWYEVINVSNPPLDLNV